MAEQTARWQPIETAPRDGTPIETKNYGDTDATDIVCWSEARVCMLGSVAPGAGMCGSGWNSINAGNLPVDEPDQWRPYRNPTP